MHLILIMKNGIREDPRYQCRGHELFFLVLSVASSFISLNPDRQFFDLAMLSHLGNGMFSAGLYERGGLSLLHDLSDFLIQSKIS